MFWLQYKEAGCFDWREFGQCYETTREVDLKSLERKYQGYKFRLQFRDAGWRNSFGISELVL